MPTISTFYGILIRMFFNDHPPPHFHARYGEFEATIDIGTLTIMEGQLPGRALNLVHETACYIVTPGAFRLVTRMNYAKGLIAATAKHKR